MKSISIVFPVHNEINNLEELISSWHNTLSKYQVEHEFVIVEDGSTDGTKELIVQLEDNFPIINLSQSNKRGYSKAIVDGIYASTKNYILCTDSDNQIKVSSLIENIENFPNHKEFLMGYRNPRNDPFNRILYSKMFKLFHDFIFSSKLQDPSCPFVIGSKNLFLSMEKKKLLYMKEGFWWGFVGVCKINNYKIIEVPIKHFKRESGQAGYEFKNLFGIIIRNIIGLLKIKFN